MGEQLKEADIDAAWSDADEPQAQVQSLTRPETEIIVDDEITDIAVVPPTVLGELARSEIETQISAARQHPRSIGQFKKDLLNMVTLDEDTAAGCFYHLKRGGKTIEGPTIRFAECAYLAWGNVRSATRSIDIGEEFVTAQAFVVDVQRNVAHAEEHKRRILDKNGSRYNTDMIQVTMAAAQKIALRNAILAVIPRMFMRQALDAARKISVRGADGKKPLGVRRREIVDQLIKRGVSEKRVLATLGRAGIDDMTWEDLETLIGLGTAVKDGLTTLEEAFGATGSDRDRLAKAAES